LRKGTSAEQREGQKEKKKLGPRDH
jgi:hypothetical protein